MEKILVTGASGQLGAELVAALRAKYGEKQVISSDIKETPNDPNFLMLDILNKTRLREIVIEHKVTQIYHLAAILSASGEWDPKKTWNVNLNGLLTILNLGQEGLIDKIFFPSTIAVHGLNTPKQNTPQFTDFTPSTVYGISKITGELWCNYYHKRYGVDVRSLRYPGIISWKTKPHGGTTDYAVEIFYDAIEKGSYECFLQEDTMLPMMYIDDAISGTLQLMDADKEKLSLRTSYNLAAVSFTPSQISQLIKDKMPDFNISYKPDFRQAIADSWSQTIDDSYARKDWGWKPKFDLNDIVDMMLEKLNIKLKQ